MNAMTSEPIEAVLALLGRQGTYRLVRALLEKPGRFGELQSVTGLLPRTLSMRLKEMGQAGWVERRQFAEVPPKVEYRLTAAGRALGPVLESIEAWARKHA